VRIHRVFVADLRAGETVLSGSEAQHLLGVLRAGPGTRVRAFDGRGLEADGVVTGAEPLRVTLELDAPHKSVVEASLSVTLAVALLKGDKLSEVVRRGTELGVVRFVLFVSERCDVREVSPNKLLRLRRVAQEAAKQSGRSVVPEITEPQKLEALKPVEPDGLCLVAQPHARSTLQGVLSEHTPERVTVVTGPEGGLSPAEVEALRAAGAHVVHLGARILRAETAPVALAAALLIPEAL
jgi:16S rRNA (uracil1498-N3)-methyltransferase